MRSHRQLQLFSTSFIDLMACALAGAAILWVLTLEASPAAGEQPARRSAWLRLSQAGLSHFDERAVRLEGPGIPGGWTLEDFADSPERVTERGTRVTLTFQEPQRSEESEFGGWLTLLVQELSEPLTLSLAFHPCQIYDEVHFIQLDRRDAAGARSELYLFTRECSLHGAVGLPSSRDCARSPDPAVAGPLLADLARRLQGLPGGADREPVVHVLDPELSPAWRIGLGSGARAQVVPPPVWTAAQDWLRAALEAL